MHSLGDATQQRLSGVVREPLGFNRAAAELLAERLLRAGEDGVLVAPNVLLDAYSRAKVRRGPRPAWQPRALVPGRRQAGARQVPGQCPACAPRGGVGCPRSLAPPNRRKPTSACTTWAARLLMSSAGSRAWHAPPGRAMGTKACRLFLGRPLPGRRCLSKHPGVRQFGVQGSAPEQGRAGQARAGLKCVPPAPGTICASAFWRWRSG